MNKHKMNENSCNVCYFPTITVSFFIFAEFVMKSASLIEWGRLKTKLRKTQPKSEQWENLLRFGYITHFY